MAIDTRFKPLILISFYSICYFIIFLLLPNKKNLLQIQIAKKKGDESALRNHSTLKMIVLVYSVNSLKWKKSNNSLWWNKISCNIALNSLLFWFPKECWGDFVALTGWRHWGWPMDFSSFCRNSLKGLKGDSASSYLQGPT